MKRKRMKRGLSTLLALAMVFSMGTSPAMMVYALDDESPDDDIEEICDEDEAVDEDSNDEEAVSEKETETGKIESENEDLNEDAYPEEPMNEEEEISADSSETEDYEESDNKDIVTFSADSDENEVMPLDATGEVLTESGGTLSSGEYYLEDDIELLNDITISGEVTIDLNGHTLTGTGEGTVIYIKSGTFTLKDSSDSGSGILTGGMTGNTIDVRGTFVMEGGNIAGNKGENPYMFIMLPLS